MPLGRIYRFLNPPGRTVAPMSKAISIARTAAVRSAGHARIAIVLACAAALILAGEALPLF